jgi:hypothetical protein
MLLAGCAPSNTADQGPPYPRAKAAFQSGRLQRALDLTDKLVVANPPDDYTARARVLRVVIYAGQLRSGKALAESFAKGAEKTKNHDWEIAYRRRQNDNLQAAGIAAMGLAETTHQLAHDGSIDKQLVLETNFPTVEGPTDIPELATIEKGDWVEPEKQDSITVDSLRKSLSDTLADLVGGDRAKAHQALAGGSTQIDGLALALFLAREMAEGAVVFDRHHGMNPQRFDILCNEGDEALKAAGALLQATPNKDQQKEVKKLQDKFKALRKDTYVTP